MQKTPSRPWEAKLKYHTSTSLNTHSKVKRTKRGRPKAEDPQIITYQLDCAIEKDTAKIQKEQEGKGFFIIATNELDKEALPPEKTPLCVQRWTTIR